MKKGYYLKLIYQTVQEFNIIPMTSVCQQACLFCSHRFNPGDIEVYSGGHLDKGMVFSLFEYIDKDKPVYIGESATRIIEGEPFNHPDWQEILIEFRERFPETPLRITTSAAGLKKEDIKLLADLDRPARGLRLTISVNLLDEEKRDEVLGAGCNKKIYDILKELYRYQIDIEASFVAIPKITGWGELERSLYKLTEFKNIQLARVLLAGYSKYADDQIKNKFQVDRLELQKKVEALNNNLSFPIVFEPAIINDLKAEVIGVIDNTPASKAGVKKDDIIIKVSGNEIFSRVDAFNKFKKNLISENKFKVLIERENKLKELEVNASGWEEHDYTGLVMARDFSPGEFNKMKKELAFHQPEKVLILTSELARDRLVLIVKLLEEEFDIDIDVMPVPANYFGGNIGSAGLLVIEDYKAIRYKVDQLEYDLIITSSALFDLDGRDLKGDYRSELKDMFESELIII
ncbi:MAG: DUF512 domain-containing protein [Bacillota bacterium]